MGAKHTYLALLFFIGVLVTPALKAQVTIYSEDFENGCASGCGVGTVGWTIVNNVGGSNGGSPNGWVVSCADNGQPAGSCGAGCGSNETLHIGSSIGDLGASYNETGASNATYQLVRSPIIDCSAYSNITISFDFIGYGSAAGSEDHGEVWMSTDGGTTWPVAYRSILNAPCCGACDGYSQGQWTAFSQVLPAAFDNNANVRIGFHWQNNGNGLGTDPSVAINDVLLTTPTVLPVEMGNFVAMEKDNNIHLKWETLSESNFSHFDVLRSTDGINFSKAGKVDALGHSDKTSNYNYHEMRKNDGVLFYKLLIVDNDGQSASSKVVTVKSTANELLNVLSFNTSNETNRLRTTFYAAESFSARVVLSDIKGNTIADRGNYQFNAGVTNFDYDTEGLAQGTYILRITSNSQPAGYEPVSITRKFPILK